MVEIFRIILACVLFGTALLLELDFKCRNTDVFPEDSFQLTCSLYYTEPFKNVNISLYWPNINTRQLQPLLNSYRISNPFGALDDVTVTSDDDVTRTKIQAKFDFFPENKDILFDLTVRAEKIEVGDKIIVKGFASVQNYNGDITSAKSPSIITCVGPCLTVTSQEDDVTRRSGNSYSMETTVQSCPDATEDPLNVKVLIKASAGLRYKSGVSAISSTGILDTVALSFNKWVTIDNVYRNQTLTLWYDYDVTNDVILNSMATIETIVEYTATNEKTYNATSSTEWPTESLECNSCHLNFDLTITPDDGFEITTCVTIPPGTVYLDLNLEFLQQQNSLKLVINSGSVTSQKEIIINNKRTRNFNERVTPIRRKRSIDDDVTDTWAIGNVTNPQTDNNMLIIVAQVAPKVTSRAAGDQISGEMIVSMTELGRILERTVVVTSPELSVNKSVQVTDTAANPDVFRISLQGKPLANYVTAYDVIVSESTAELSALEYIIPTDTSRIEVQNNAGITKFFAGNITNSTVFQVVYDATVRDFGSEVTSTVFVTSSITYYTTQQRTLQRTVNATVCLTVNPVPTTCIWCAVLLIIICLLVGFLLAALIMACWVACIPRSMPLVGPGSKTKKSSTDISLSKNMTEMLQLDSKTEISQAAVMFHLDAMLDLDRKIRESRTLLISQGFRLILKHNTTYENRAEREEYYRLLEHFDHHLKEKQKRNVVHANVKRTRTIPYVDFKHWKERLREFNPEFRNEVLKMLQKIKTRQLVSENFLRYLYEQSDSYLETCEDKSYDELLKDIEKLSERNKSTFALAQLVHDVSVKLDQIMRNNVQKIALWTRSRERESFKRYDERTLKKKTWNQIAMLQAEIIEKAERQEILAPDDKEELFAFVLSYMSEAKGKFDNELPKIQKQLCTEYEATTASTKKKNKARENETSGQSISDIELLPKWIDQVMFKLESNLATDRENEMSFDRLAFDGYRNIEGLVNEINQDIEVGKSNLKSLLISKGARKNWVETVFRKKEQKLEKSSMETTQQTETLKRRHVKQDNTGVQLLDKIFYSQQEVRTKETICFYCQQSQNMSDVQTRMIKELLESRISEHLRMEQLMKEASEAVPQGVTEEEIRLELKEKLSIYCGDGPFVGTPGKTKLKTKKLNQLVGIQNSVSALPAPRISDAKSLLDLECKRRAVEDLMMTFLELMTSSEKIKPETCKIVLHEYKTQREGITGKISDERKMRENELKEEVSKRLLCLNKAEEVAQSFDMARELMPAGLNITARALERCKKQTIRERLTLQHLFGIKEEFRMKKQKALFDQDMLLVRGLVTASGASYADVRDALQLLLPGQPTAEIEAMVRYIHPNKQNKTNTSFGILVKRIEEIVKQRQLKSKNKTSSIKRKVSFAQDRMKPVQLDPLGGNRDLHKLGTRPEPLGRIASPDHGTR
nr:uncharacterized protein LOC100180934 [Ciona intestinalis]|eukprot:XP_009857461.2 uncharacterized protein LOC100180934 [Ciona intestinalis]